MPETDIAEQKRLAEEAFGEPAGFPSPAHEEAWLRAEGKIQKLIVRWGYRQWQQFEADYRGGLPPRGVSSTTVRGGPR